MAEGAPVDKRELVSGHFLLDRLEPDELDRLMAFARSERYDGGEVIFRKGEPGHSMMMIVSGRIKISSASRHGKEVVLAVLGPGEVVGEMAILEDKTRSADATALERSEVLVLQRRDFIPFLERNPQISIRMLGILSARLRRTSEKLRDRAFMSLSSRLAKTLLDLALTDGRDQPEGVRIAVTLSQKNLGALLGASRESVNKQLRAWQSEGLIRMGRGHIILNQPQDLALLIEAGPDE